MKSSVSFVPLILCAIVAMAFTTMDADAQVWRVDKSAEGAGNGLTWADAFTTIQPAIDAAFVAGGGEVWIAGGPVGSPVVYNETRTETWGGVTGSLVMKDNVHVYGGFEGWRSGTGLQEAARAQAVPAQNIAVIDGSVARAGSPAYHVVVFGRGAAATINARLVNVTITGGNASGVPANYHTWRGGGIYVWQSSPLISGCVIYGNTAAVSGAGVDNERGPASAADTAYVNCVIAANRAQRLDEGANNPIRGGGGAFDNKCNPSYTHVTFADNSTDPTGAMGGFPNYGLNSGGIYNWGDFEAAASSAVESSILWDNTGTGILNEGGNSSATVNYTDIQGGWAGTGNINANPNFVGSFLPWPYEINGAPCVDAASSAQNVDIRNLPRPLGGARDMGAYEYSANGPTAVCAAYTVNLDASCAGTLTPANISGGSTAEAGIWKLAASQTTFGSADIPSKSVTLTVTDVLGRAATCNATVTVADPIAPVITSCAPDQLLNLDASCQAPIPNLTGLVVATDNCGIDSITQSPLAGTLISVNTPVVLTVTDVDGTTAQCTANVNVQDLIPPVAVCQNITVNLSAPTVAAAAIDGSSSDNCGIASRLIDGAADKTFSCADLGANSVTLSIADAAGNPDSCAATVTVVDDINPVAVCQNITVNLSAPTIGAAAVDGGSSDNCGITSMLIDGAADKTFTCADLGANSVTLSIADAAGNPASCVATVTVVDDIAPVISVTGNDPVTVECSTSYTDDGATALDNCDGDLTGAIAVVNPVDPNITGVYTVTYNVSDASGNPAAQATRTVNVVDTIAPEITLLGDPVIFVEMNTTYTDDGATASDLCDGSLTASIVTVNPVDTSIPDTYIVTYNVADASGNNAVEVTRTVIVPDTSQPDIVLVDVETALTVLVTYNKNMDGGLGMDVAASYTVSGSGIGTFSANPDSVERVSGTVYRLIWTRPDEMLNGGDIVITVDPNVEDSAGNFMRDNVGEDLGGAIGEAPVITMNGADETLECNLDTFTEAGASAADNVDGSVPVIITGDDLVNTAVTGAYIVSYDAEDAAGNAATVSRTITVADTGSPVVELLGAAALQLECNLENYEEVGATATDACEGDLTSAIVIGDGANTAILGLQIVTYNVTDGAGNSGSAEREVTVVDSTPPDLALLGPNPYVTTDGGLYAEPGATAFDACEGDLTGEIDIAGDVPNTDVVAVYVLTYSVDDSSANTAQATRTVVVKPESCALAYSLTITPNPAVPGAEVTLEAAALPESCSAGTLEFVWQKAPAVGEDFVTISEAPNAAVYVIPSADFDDAGVYRCTVSDASSSVNTNEEVLYVGTGVPVAGVFGMMFAAAAAALAGAVSIRRRR